ncbi:anti-sigma factor family protein [Chelatococcus sp. GCM10030263]|uniref:anti-sigma factor family protein n=1 Tax=Chelatococcus sp. GCM10030263 TaxID=3273387 RepID=UPI003606E3DB
MSSIHLRDEILMAFADGELDETVAAAVEQAMRDDPAVVARVVNFARSRRIARSAFLAEVAPAPSSALEDAVLAQIRAVEGGPRPASGRTGRQEGAAQGWSRRILPLAACLAAVVAGGLGYLAGTRSGPAAGHVGLVADLQSPTVTERLDRISSGHEEDTTSGRLRVVSTIRTANGALCREFELAQAPRKADAIACRQGGEWGVTLAVIGEESTGYRPADGSDVVGNYLQSVGAGAPLTGPDEVKALAELTR